MLATDPQLRPTAADLKHRLALINQFRNGGNGENHLQIFRECCSVSYVTAEEHSSVVESLTKEMKELKAEIIRSQRNHEAEVHRLEDEFDQYRAKTRSKHEEETALRDQKLTSKVKEIEELQAQLLESQSVYQEMTREIKLELKESLDQVSQGLRQKEQSEQKILDKEKEIQRLKAEGLEARSVHEAMTNEMMDAFGINNEKMVKKIQLQAKEIERLKGNKMRPQNEREMKSVRRKKTDVVKQGELPDESQELQGPHEGTDKETLPKEKNIEQPNQEPLLGPADQSEVQEAKKHLVKTASWGVGMPLKTTVRKALTNLDQMFKEWDEYNSEWTRKP